MGLFSTKPSSKSVAPKSPAVKIDPVKKRFDLNKIGTGGRFRPGKKGLKSALYAHRRKGKSYLSKKDLAKFQEVMDPILRAMSSGADKVSNRGQAKAFVKFKAMVNKGEITSTDKSEFKRIIKAMTSSAKKEAPVIKQSKKTKEAKIKTRPKKASDYLKDDRMLGGLIKGDKKDDSGSGMRERYSILKKDKYKGKEKKIVEKTNFKSVRVVPHGLEARERGGEEDKREESQVIVTPRNDDRLNSINESLSQREATEEPADLPID